MTDAVIQAGKLPNQDHAWVKRSFTPRVEQLGQSIRVILSPAGKIGGKRHGGYLSYAARRRLEKLCGF